MPAHNVNTAALEQVVEAARRFETLAETLNLSPVDNEDFALTTSIWMMERVLEVADGNAVTVALEDGRAH
jgi:predicted nucleic acid-binding protein